MTVLHHARFALDLPKGRQFRVVGLGQNAVDWICYLPIFPHHNSKLRIDRLEKIAGGPVATASSLCARYGLATRYVGRVGDDEMGRLSMRSLQREPMDLSCVETVEGAFGQYAIVLVDRPSGERTILWDRDPALRYQAQQLQRDWIVAGQLLHLDGDDEEASIKAARWAREAGMTVTLDIDRVQPRTNELLELVDIAIPSEDFLIRFSANGDWRRGLRCLAERTRFAGSTCGSRGCHFFWEGEILEVPGFPVKPIDTTGAGDVFHGAFCYALFQDWSIWQSLRFANAAAALSCTRRGSRGGIPQLDEVGALLARRILPPSV